MLDLVKGIVVFSLVKVGVFRWGSMGLGFEIVWFGEGVRVAAKVKRCGDFGG